MNAEKKKIIAVALAAVCVIACIAGAYAVGYSRGFHSRTTALKDNGKNSAQKDSQEISEDEIEPLSEDTISVLCCGVDNTQKLTDVIMYALFDTKAKTVEILRIPRDTFVGSEFPTGKVNAVYGHPYEGMNGIETLKKYLEEKWKLDIDYYATIDLASVRDIVDDMGGVTMNIEEQINYLPGKVLYPGEQTLTGEQAEWIIRYRAGYANGDLGRIDAQTQFIFACIDRVHELGRMKCIPILMKHYDDVDTDMPLNKMVSVASALFELKTDDIEMHVVPGKGTMYYSYSVYAVDKAELVEILNDSFMPEGKTVTAADLGIPDLYGGSSSQSSSSYPSGSSNNGNYSSGNYNSGGNTGYQQNQTEYGQQQTENEQNEAPSAPYQYDKNGNPLYRLDENGNPIYDYDEDGNIVYVYQQAEKQESQKPQKEESEKKDEQSSSDKDADSSEKKPSKKEDDRKVILSKSNQEKLENQENQEEENSKDEDKDSSDNTGFHFSNRG